MRILLTGASGYLGSHLCRQLVACGHEVAILVRHSSKLERLGQLLPHISVHILEHIDLKALLSAGPRETVVFHVATCYGRNGEGAAEILEVNTAMPLRLLDAATERHIALVNVDTVLPRELSPYSISKAQFVDWGRLFAAQRGSSFLNVRIDQFFGPWDSEWKFASSIIRSCARNAPQVDLTAGDQERDFLFIDDVVDAFVVLMNTTVADLRGFSECGIGSGRPVTVRHFAESVHRLSNSTSRLEFGAIPYRPGEPMKSTVDSSLIRSLGWRPRVTLEAGIKHVMVQEGLS